jgi:hypothetical protein
MNPIKLQGQETTILFGVVEDLQDPEQLGRVRIRLPLHGSKTDTATTMLPWAKTISPAMGVGPNQGGGGGQGGVSVSKDATVICLLNHDNHEDITVLGVLPTNSSGKNIIGASAAGQSTMALGGINGGVSGGKFEPATDASKAVLNPAPPSFPQTKGKYPDTHVNVSKAGMRSIIHDVSGEVYQSIVHPTGTFTEMQSDGNYVTYTTKDRKEAVDGEYTLFSEKNMVIATNGDLQIKVKGNVLIESEGDKVEAIRGYRESYVGIYDRTYVKENHEVVVTGKASILADSITQFAPSKIDLNNPADAGLASVEKGKVQNQDQIRSNINRGEFAKKISN